MTNGYAPSPHEEHHLHPDRWYCTINIAIPSPSHAKPRPGAPNSKYPIPKITHAIPPPQSIKLTIALAITWDTPMIRFILSIIALI